MQDGRISSDTQRQGQHRHGGEAGGFCQGAEGETEVFGEVFKESPHPNGADSSFACSTPSCIFSCVSSATEDWSSSSKICSTALLRRRLRSKLTVRLTMMLPFELRRIPPAPS